MGRARVPRAGGARTPKRRPRTAGERKGQRREEDRGNRSAQVVGIDAGGQWPGGADNDPGADFIRYVYQAPEAGEPADVFNPVQPASETRR